MKSNANLGWNNMNRGFRDEGFPYIFFLLASDVGEVAFSVKKIKKEINADINFALLQLDNMLP